MILRFSSGRAHPPHEVFAFFARYADVAGGVVSDFEHLVVTQRCEASYRYKLAFL